EPVLTPGILVELRWRRVDPQLLVHLTGDVAPRLLPRALDEIRDPLPVGRVGAQVGRHQARRLRAPLEVATVRALVVVLTRRVAVAAAREAAFDVEPVGDRVLLVGELAEHRDRFALELLGLEGTAPADRLDLDPVA